ncbi:protein ENDOSPERM DEFECTIVE 1-like [Silene latifolia]|uniref:protein ENDOSPERM DEFECTIVE 1-like n=1 Tax=Silene latifolia TaxID=37657 RepID=UPI003D778A41
MAEFPKPPTSTSTSTPSDMATPANHNPPRRSRPRVREVSSRFMSPAISTPKQPSINSLRRSQTDLRPKYADENRPESLNRTSVSPVRSNKPRSAVKLFKETSRSDTPAMVPVPGRSIRHPNWDTAASKLLTVMADNSSSIDCSSSVDGDCESVRSEPCEIGQSNGGNRVSTPCSRSMELSFSSHEQGNVVNGNVDGTIRRKDGGNEEKMGGLMMRGSVKVGRSLKLPPVPLPPGGAKGQVAVEVKKAVRKGSSQVEDVHRLRLMYNHYLQWRFANAKAQASFVNQQKQSERQLYSLGVKISDLRDSVQSKRIEYGLLKQMETLSTVLDAQLPNLEGWASIEESYSSSLLELSNGLLNVLSQLPLVGNVRVDLKEIEEALNSAAKATEMICLQVQNFIPKAENMDSLVSNLARVYSGELTLVDECGDLLYKTHASQVEECSLRGQLMELQRCKLDKPKNGQC